MFKPKHASIEPTRKHLNILYYIPELKQEFGGVRQYAAGLLKAMAQLSDCTIYVLHDIPDDVIIEVVQESSNLTIVKSSEVKQSERRILSNKFFIWFNEFLENKFKLKLISTLKVKNVVDLLIRKYNINIVHCPYQFIPEVSTNKVKLITTMHDIQELHFPEFFPANTREYRAVFYRKFIDKSDAVVVSYNHIKNDIVKFFDKKQESIYTILIKMENLWFKKFLIGEKINEKKNTTKYLLYPANAWKHKNHIVLLKAILLLKEKLNILIQIKLTGDFESEYGLSLKSFVTNNNLNTQVSFEGVVKEEYLFHLYKNAWGVVVPTLYEAGSFPLIESILLDVPVICSNVTSLPDTICNEASLFDPNDIQGLADKLKLFWLDEAFRNAVTPTETAKEKILNTNCTQLLTKLYKDLYTNTI